MNKALRRVAAISISTLTIIGLASPAAHAAGSKLMDLYVGGRYVGTLYGSSYVTTSDRGTKIGYARSAVRNTLTPFSTYAKITTGVGSAERWCYGGGDCSVTVAAGGSNPLSVKGVHKARALNKTSTLNS